MTERQVAGAKASADFAARSAGGKSDFIAERRQSRARVWRSMLGVLGLFWVIVLLTLMTCSGATFN